MAESFDPEQRAALDAYDDDESPGGSRAEHLAVYKQRLLERVLGKGFARPILDFGCGIGQLTERLTRSFPVVHGYDPSSESAEIAQQRVPSATFFDDTEALPKDHYGAVVLANVLHHVPPPNRPGLLKIVSDVLARGGRAVIFELNPLNPITRRAVAISPFDEASELLYPWAVKRLLKRAGFTKVDLDYIGFFPHLLSAVRPVEATLSWLPLGAQTCAWGTKR